MAMVANHGLAKLPRVQTAHFFPSCGSPRLQPTMESITWLGAISPLFCYKSWHSSFRRTLLRDAGPPLSRRRSLLLENLALRQQLVALKRRNPVSGELLFRQPADQNVTMLHCIENVPPYQFAGDRFDQTTFDGDAYFTPQASYANEVLAV
jgi:hypothetical protein